jgi:hypothetical protein
MGDFNFPLLHLPDLVTAHSSVSMTHRFQETLINMGLTEHIRSGTRLGTNNHLSRLDLVLTNEPLLVDEVVLSSPLGLSDHAVVTFKFVDNSYRIDALEPPRRAFSFANYTLIREHLNTADWSIKPNSSVDEHWAHIRDTILNAIYRFIPFRKRQTHKPGQWLSRSTKKLISLKRSAWVLLTSDDTLSSRSSYTTLRNKCNAAVKRDKLNFQTKMAYRVHNNPKSFYAYLSSISKSKPGVPNIQTVNGLTTSDRDTAEVMAAELAKVYNHIPSQTPIPQTVAPHMYNDPLLPLHLTPFQVYDKLVHLQMDKSQGPDDIPPRFLKECAAVLTQHLHALFLHSLEAGCIPSEWKHCVVMPLHKGGQRTQASNYRPIALLSCISKVMESLVDDYIRHHLYTTGFLAQQQHGFRRAHSCNTNLLLATDSWSSHLESGRGVDVIYLDFAKAFDRVDHEILLAKVHRCGVDGSMLHWIRDYLQQRTFSVRVHGQLSNTLPAPKGVPQGSILGPLLFLIFINDVTSVMRNPCLLYADDIKLWSPITSNLDGDLLQKDLDDLHNWAILNKLPFNASKCTVLHIKQSTPRDYFLDTVPLRPVTQQKDLGSIITSSLSFSINSALLARKANSVMYLLHRNLGRVHPDCFPTIFKTMVRPHLEINSLACAPMLMKDMDTLERVQRRATKRVYGLSNTAYPDRLRKLNMFSLSYRRTRGDMIMTHKILHTPDHPCLSIIHRKAPDNLRGHTLKLEHQRSKLAVRHHAFGDRVPRTWNYLPSEVVNATSTTQFKFLFDCNFSHAAYVPNEHILGPNHQ